SGTTSAGNDLSDTADEPKFDIPVNDDPLPTMGGCHKADFLFVIDNSGSMADEQANLIASFPGFIKTITETVQAQDYHIMAVPTDDGNGAGLATKCTMGACSCKPAPTCCEKTCELFGTNCNGDPCDNLPITACDKVYGRGNLYNADGVRCELAGDRRYMADDQPMLNEAFECIANIGTHGGGYEKPILATLEALSADMNKPGGCNEGFLRDDAILVVIIITDEEDDDAVPGQGSPGDPPEWYQQLVAAKHGDADAVVVLGLVGDGNIPGGICPPDGAPSMQGQNAESAPRLQQFVELFPNGVLGSVCAPDYTPFFLEAVNVIDFACDVFEPVG
ncbi:MAG TPA: hypothetical protein VIK91_00645, partial [Nannocystis sp.]